MLERAIMIYLALATVATAAIFPLPLRASGTMAREQRLPSEPPTPAPPDQVIAPLVAAELSDDGCATCDEAALGRLWVEVAGAMESALNRPLASPSLADDDDDEALGAGDLVGRDLLLAKPNPPRPPKGEQLADVAAELAGLPYSWGGISPATGFDCSGLVYYVHGQFGIKLGRDASAQYYSGQEVQKSDLRPGDIVFFSETYTSGISHNGIYLEGGRFVHAVQPGSGVKITSIGDDYWDPRYVGARRVFAA